MCTVCEQQPGLVTAADFFFSGYLIVLCHSFVVWWVGGLSGRMAICSVCVWQHYCPAQITKCLRVTPGAFTKCWWQMFSLLHPFHRVILRALSTSAKIGLSGRLWDVEAAKDFLLETVLCLSFVLRGKYFCSLIYIFFSSSKERPIHNKLETYFNFDRWKPCHNACALGTGNIWYWNPKFRFIKGFHWLVLLIFGFFWV